MAELLDGELLDWDAFEEEAGREVSDGEIDAKYVRGEVRIVTEQGRYPLNTVPDLVKSTNYELSPDFQRRRLWPAEKQSRLIESFIMNVPVPPIFLYEDSYSHYEVMDGLQRLTAIEEFYEDRLTLVGLEEWSELNGRTYSTLPEQVRRGIDRRYLSSVVLLYETAKDPREAQRLKQLVFERINSGGIDLSAQETRNALYPGPMNRLCIKLSRNASLCRLWGIPVPEPSEEQTGEPSAERAKTDDFKRMSDVEWVLRFFAHRQRARLAKSGRLDRFLDRFLRSANEWSPDLLAQLESLFEETIKLVEDVLGERAFWLWRDRQGQRQWVRRPTLVAYDPVMHGFSSHLQDAGMLRAKAAEIREQISAFYDANYDVFDGRKVNASDVARRDEAFDQFLLTFID